MALPVDGVKRDGELPHGEIRVFKAWDVDENFRVLLSQVKDSLRFEILKKDLRGEFRFETAYPIEIPMGDSLNDYVAQIRELPVRFRGVNQTPEIVWPGHPIVNQIRHDIVAVDSVVTRIVHVLRYPLLVIAALFVSEKMQKEEKKPGWKAYFWKPAPTKKWWHPR